jgi:hypothetical protein
MFKNISFFIITMFPRCRGPGWLNELGRWIQQLSYKPITNTAWVRAPICKLQKRVHSTRSHK